MNKDITVLIIRNIHSQQNLNRPKEKLRTMHWPIVDFSFGECFVEKLLRVYKSEYKHIKLSVHRINSFSTIIKSVGIYIMTIQEAKQIRIADYLQSLGYTPVKQQGNSLWYKSPLREEAEASFKVNTELNQWYDFGIGRGGNIIAHCRNSTVPTMCRICWSALPNRHRNRTQPIIHHSLLVGNPFQNRCTDTCKFRSYYLLHYYPICRKEG